ncbi:MAG TPA: hypothetical protein VMD59_17915 [Acidimicrobiales bacterium]|nr:hypothetical protein [Acidimicrobiales bacterium]
MRRKRPTPQGAIAPLVAALMVLAMSVAACGGSPPTSVASLGSTTTTRPTSVAQTASAAALRYANCLRAHGFPNYPDSAVSVIGGQVEIHVPLGIKSEPEFGLASQACSGELPGGPPPAKHVNVQAELEYARCMRSHGISDFPDPLTGGGFHITFDTNSPQFESADRACGEKFSK